MLVSWAVGASGRKSDTLLIASLRGALNAYRAAYWPLLSERLRRRDDGARLLQEIARAVPHEGVVPHDWSKVA